MFGVIVQYNQYIYICIYPRVQQYISDYQGHGIMAHHKCEISCADLLSCQADDATSQEEGTAHMTIMIALLMK